MLIISKGINPDFCYKALGAVVCFDSFNDFGSPNKEQHIELIIKNLTAKAEKLGANAILGLDFSLTSGSDGENLYTDIIATGTAVLI